jgi:hypothetical protein
VYTCCAWAGGTFFCCLREAFFYGSGGVIKRKREKRKKRGKERKKRGKREEKEEKEKEGKEREGVNREVPQLIPIL